MKFSTREDIDAPIDRVYASVSDFAGIERLIRRRGVAIEREGSGGTGTRWRAHFSWRKRPYDVEAEVVDVDEGQGYAIESRAGGVTGLTVVDLVALSQTRTRLLVSLELKPSTLSSRLLLQSLKLAKGRLSARFAERVAEFARRIESSGA